MNVIETIEQSKRYGEYFINALVNQHKPFYRIIVDKAIPFPINLFLVKHDSDIEISTVPWHKSPNKGWGRPDKMLSENLELRYLMKQFKPMSFYEWRKSSEKINNIKKDI